MSSDFGDPAQLDSGIPLPASAAASGMWQEHGLLVIDPTKHEFPSICVRTGLSNDVTWRQESLMFLPVTKRWHTILLYFTIGAVGLAIATRICGERVSVSLPLQAAIADRRNRGSRFGARLTAFGFVLFLVGTIAAIFLAFNGNAAMTLALLLGVGIGLLVLFLGLVYLVIFSWPILRFRTVEGKYVKLAGAHPALLNQLGPFLGERGIAAAEHRERVLSGAAQHRSEDSFFNPGVAAHIVVLILIAILAAQVAYLVYSPDSSREKALVVVGTIAVLAVGILWLMSLNTSDWRLGATAMTLALLPGLHFGLRGTKLFGDYAAGQSRIVRAEQHLQEHAEAAERQKLEAERRKHDPHGILVAKKLEPRKVIESPTPVGRNIAFNEPDLVDRFRVQVVNSDFLNGKIPTQGDCTLTYAPTRTWAR